MAQLIDHLRATGRSISSVAKEWGIEKSTLSRAIKGERWPGELILVRSHEMTEGQCGLADWIETCRARLETSGIIKEGESNGRRTSGAQAGREEGGEGGKAGSSRGRRRAGRAEG